MPNTPRRRRRTLVGNQRTRRRRRTIVKSRSSDPLSGFDFSSPRNSRREANIYRRASKKKRSTKRKKYRKRSRKRMRKNMKGGAGAGDRLKWNMNDVKLNPGTILGAGFGESLSNEFEHTEAWEPFLVAVGATAGNKLGNKILNYQNTNTQRYANRGAQTDESNI